MPQEPLAKRVEPAPPSQADYDSFCDTVMATARGRSFLAEYASRHRNADTQTVLTALRRIEASIRDGAPARQFDRLRDELRALIATIREARTDLTAATGGFTKAETLMALLDMLESRIAGMIEPRRNEDASAVVPIRPVEEKTEGARVHLTIVPPPQEPSPEPPQAAIIAPVAANAVALLPPPSCIGTPPVAVEPSEPPAAELFPDEIFVPLEPQPQPIQQALPNQALAAVMAEVMALSEAERIALFT